MQALQWTLLDTGGQCKALRHELPRDHFALVTDDSGAYTPSSSDNVLLGIYNDHNGDTVSYAALADLPEAERVIIAVNYLLSRDDEPRVLCWQIPTELEDCFHAALDAKVIDIDADDCYYIVDQGEI